MATNVNVLKRFTVLFSTYYSFYPAGASNWFRTCFAVLREINSESKSAIQITECQETTVEGEITRRSRVSLHLSNEKMRFQSSFILITFQLFFFACAISASVNVPTLDFGP